MTVIQAFRMPPQRRVAPALQFGNVDATSQLVEALNKQDLPAALAAVRNGGDVKAKNFADMTVLHLIVDKGTPEDNLQDMEDVIQRGADLNANGYWGTALMIAVRKDTTAWTEALLKHKPNLDEAGGKHSCGREPALRSAKFPNARLLIAAGASRACIQNNTLLQHAIDAACHLPNEQKALNPTIKEMIAAASLEEINYVNDRGHTALSLALMHNNAEIVDALLAKNPDVKNAPVLSMVKDVATAKRLIALGAVVNVGEQMRYTPVGRAIEALNPELVKLYLDNHADLHAFKGQKDGSVWDLTETFVTSLVADGWIGMRPNAIAVQTNLPKIMIHLVDGGAEITSDALQQAMRGRFQDALAHMLEKLHQNGASFPEIAERLIGPAEEQG